VVEAANKVQETCDRTTLLRVVNSSETDDSREVAQKKNGLAPQASKPLILKDLWRGWQDSNPRPLGS